MADDFSHIDEHGRSRMVDVGGKTPTRRLAVARAKVVMSPKTYALLVQKALPKGDALGAARLAGIMAAKKTAEIIPLCHPLPLSHAAMEFRAQPRASAAPLAVRLKRRRHAENAEAVIFSLQ